MHCRYNIDTCNVHWYNLSSFETHMLILCTCTFAGGPYMCIPGMRGGLMVSVLNSGSSGLGLSPGWRHCVVLLGKTPYFHSASLHLGV